MQQTQSIFDDAFRNPQLPRRRSLLSNPLKVYLWVLMLVGAVFFTAMCVYFVYMIGELFFTEKKTSLQPAFVVIMQYVTGLVSILVAGAMMFVPPLFIWLERKWAIRYNWLVVALWIGLLIFGIWLVGSDGTYVLIPIFIYCPYWLHLFKIQQDWEENAVAGAYFKR